MILVLDNFLTDDEVHRLRGLYRDASSRDGAATAGSALADVKRNRELELGEALSEVRSLLLSAVNRTPSLSQALLIKTMSTPVMSYYEAGMAYGGHIDSAIGNSDGSLYRTDLSATVFLDDPAGYAGGELVIETEYGTRSFKLPPGHVVFYPTLFRHEVRSVTQGTRRACVMWMESLVRDPQKRMMLFEVAKIAGWISANQPPESDVRQAAVKLRENLYRLWIGT